MICSKCKTQNSETNTFCTKCGTELSPDTEYSLYELSRQIQSIRHELREIRESLHQKSALPSIPNKVDYTRTSTASVDTETSTNRIAKTDVADFLLGGNWLARVGVIALIIGIGFFLKLAFDNNWVNEISRVGIGVIIGTSLLVLGEVWKQKYSTYAQALSGGGIAILYLSVFAASGLYNLIDSIPAVIALFLISTISAALALKYNSMALAIIGIIGAFSAPFLLGTPSQEPLSDSPPSAADGNYLIAYILIVNIAVIVLSTFKNWRWFTLLAFVASIASASIWHEEYGTYGTLFINQLFITVIFLSFIGATTLFHFIRRKAPNSIDYLLMTLNAAVYFSISFNNFETYDAKHWQGLGTFILALFYFGLAYISFLRSKEPINLTIMLAGIGSVLLVIAIPIQFDGPWITIGWATHGLVSFVLSIKLGYWQPRVIGLAVFTMLTIRLLGVESTLDAPYWVIYNVRMLAFTSSIVALYAAAYLLNRSKELVIPEDYRNWLMIIENRIVIPILVIVANLLTIWVLSAEILSAVDSDLVNLSTDAKDHIQSLSLSLFLAIYASLILVIGIMRRKLNVRLAGLALLGIPVLKLFIVDTFTLDMGYRVGAYLSLGILLMVMGFLYQRYRDHIRGFLLEAQ